MSCETGGQPRRKETPIDKLIRFCLNRGVVIFLLVVLALVFGFLNAPFEWDFFGLERDPVPVDAIPDIGENQQIVFTEWPGRSPQDVEDQVTYPLTVSLLGIPSIKTVRSYSMFGFSTIYVIFKEEADFYWSRARIVEKLNSLKAGLLPENVRPALGPDSTALGQVFWYTLEGIDPEGKPAGGWDLHELRSIQDWNVRYALLGVDGVSEVASVGGFVQEYQIDVDPAAMWANGVRLDEVFSAVRMSNTDVGARTVEVNRVEYVIRGVGFLKSLADIENTVIKVRNNVPLRVKDVAHVALGPAARRGALDKAGVEAVGGVVVVRYGENPLAVINRVKERIAELAPGLPRRTLEDGTTSQVTLVPFYDRTGLIYETLGTLKTALSQEILVTVIVVLLMLAHLRSAVLISGLLPLAVLLCFVAMRAFGVDANIVALSGIAIAIGTMVDMGVIICENILRHLARAKPDTNRLDVIFGATREVGGAVLTSVATTIVSFLPVFTMIGPEGKLFKPLAFTKTFALLASLLVAILVIPPAARLLFTGRIRSRRVRLGFLWALVAAGVILFFVHAWWSGAILIVIGLWHLGVGAIPPRLARGVAWSGSIVAALGVAILLAGYWLPLGPGKGLTTNTVFTVGLIGGILLFFLLFQRLYARILRWCLEYKALFLILPLILVLAGATIWLGFDSVFGWLPQSVKTFKPVSRVAHAFPGLGKEFMPPLDEGSYLFMPTTLAVASIGEVLDVLSKQDRAMGAIPEIDQVVGKLGRAESPLDPAPLSMIETIINYKPEFIVDRDGKRLTFRCDRDDTDLMRGEDGAPVPAPDGEPYTVLGRFDRDDGGRLIPDDEGWPFRLWRLALDPDLEGNDERDPWEGINEPDDIWDEIVEAADIPGTTSAPRLQPIAARIVMLQSGMRAPMGVKIKGPDLESIERVALEVEQFLKEVPSIEPATVNADRIVGKPYLEIRIDREAIARYGIRLAQVQNVIEVAVGGKPITRTVEGRERYPVRVRYMRELRDSIEALDRILVPAPDGTQIPLVQVASIDYVRGPQMIKSEDTFKIGYVIFDKKPGFAEVDVVEQARSYLEAKIDSGDFVLPAGVAFPAFAGSYENQVRSEKKLLVILPVALFVIFIILYLNFASVSTTFIVFSGILVAWAGGFIMVWFYGQSWFLDFEIFGTSMRALFQVHPLNLSVAVWVGFLALFGIATDDGVVMATYLDQTMKRRKPGSIAAVRDAVVEAGRRRVRPCLMTTATTVLALIPVLTSTGRGADIMVPMAIPSFGGMVFAVVTMFVVPVLYCRVNEIRVTRDESRRSKAERLKILDVRDRLNGEN